MLCYQHKHTLELVMDMSTYPMQPRPRCVVGQASN